MPRSTLRHFRRYRTSLSSLIKQLFRLYPIINIPTFRFAILLPEKIGIAGDFLVCNFFLVSQRYVHLVVSKRAIKRNCLSYASLFERNSKSKPLLLSNSRAYRRSKGRSASDYIHPGRRSFMKQQGRQNSPLSATSRCQKSHKMENYRQKHSSPLPRLI